jgi:hypothetical protein
MGEREVRKEGDFSFRFFFAYVILGFQEKDCQAAVLPGVGHLCGSRDDQARSRFVGDSLSSTAIPPNDRSPGKFGVRM